MTLRKQPQKMATGLLGLWLVVALVACSSQDTASPTTAAGGATQATDTTGNISSNTSGDTSGAKANLNTASEDELKAAVPGLGDQMLDEFMEYRPYSSIQEFREEIGKYTDAAQVAEYEEYVYVPIDVNQADAETLQQIPGLDANEAGQLIAARPFASNQDFLDQLASYVSPEEQATAEKYLTAA